MLQTASLQHKVLTYIQGVYLFFLSLVFFGTIVPFYCRTHTQDFSVFLHFSSYGLFRTRHTGLQCALSSLTWNSSLGTTYHHTPLTAVASAPPPSLFFLGFLRCVFQSKFSHFPACAMDSRVFIFILSIATDRPLRFSRLIASNDVRYLPSGFAFVFSFPFCFSTSPPSLPLTVG